MPDTSELQQLLDFTPEDLAANRVGQASPRQIQRWEANRQATLERLERGPGALPAILTLVYLVILGGVAVAFFYVGGFHTLQVALGALALPVLAAVGFILLLFVGLIPFQVRRAMQAQHTRLAALPPVASLPIEAVAGVVKTRSSYNDTTNSYWYDVRVGGKTFSVSKAVMNAFQSGKPYRVYYRTEGRTLHLVSVEALEG